MLNNSAIEKITAAICFIANSLFGKTPYTQTKNFPFYKVDVKP